MELLYVDTNIFLDALLDRDSRTGRDLGTSAMSVFSEAAACRFEILISDWTLEELHDHIEPASAQDFFNDIEHKIIRCSYTEEDKERAKEQADHWGDYLHGIIAEKEDADCIVTRNVDDFRILSGIQAKLPRHL